jgi:AcrR family transcriptional regulator
MTERLITRPDTRSAILDTAERLFGEQGLDAVSLRAIAAASGAANNSAVLYHFGDKEGLIRAIFDRRLQPIDRRRGEMLNALTAAERGDVMALLGALLRPVGEARDAAGRPSYAAFLLRLIHAGESIGRFEPFEKLMPITGLLGELLTVALGEPPQALLASRMSLVSMLYLSAITRVHFHADSWPDMGGFPIVERDALAMAACALTAPRPELATGAEE